MKRSVEVTPGASDLQITGSCLIPVRPWGPQPGDCSGDALSAWRRSPHSGAPLALASGKAVSCLSVREPLPTLRGSHAILRQREDWYRATSTPLTQDPPTRLQ